MGFSFKANTNDTRESPTITISKNLLKEGAILNFYDPKVNENRIFENFEDSELKNLFVYESALSAAKEADAIIVLTEWDEFKTLDWESIYKCMRKPAWIFDARVFLDIEKLKNIGFKVWTLGNSRRSVVWRLINSRR